MTYKYMTQEEKAKRYDEALERARKMYNKTYHPMEGPGGVCYNNADLETIFPELVESKDEKMRKAIIDFFSEPGRKEYILNGFTIDDIIAWLGKQDKHAENEDDADGDFTIYYPLKNGEGIYKCIPYSFYGMLSSFSEDKDMIDFLHLCFYTEEECNEWIKQNNPADKVETKFHVGDTVRHKNIEGSDCTIEFIDDLTYFGDTTNFDIKDQNNWELVEQKSACSEEDEKTLNEIFYVAARASLRKSTLFGKSYDYIKWQNWLKSLRYRVQQQPKQEWSEDDEDMVRYIGNALTCNESAKYLEEKGIDMIKAHRWLESFKPQKQWKPSDEQIGVIEAVINNRSFQRRHLNSLYEQLKKLKGE